MFRTFRPRCRPEASTDRVPNLLISEQWKQVSEQVFVPWATPATRVHTEPVSISRICGRVPRDASTSICGRQTMTCFGYRFATADSGLLRTARALAGVLTNPVPTGSVVTARPVIRGLRTWDHAPRTIAIIALDSGVWCYAWLLGGNGARGARARLLGRAPGDKYPTFATNSAPACVGRAGLEPATNGL